LNLPVPYGRIRHQTTVHLPRNRNCAPIEKSSSRLELSADEQTTPRLPTAVIERAIKLSCAQAMLASVFAATTGGMFLIGFALKLGANDEQIGLLTTAPMFCVVGQLLASALIYRGFSRKRLSILWTVLNMVAWPIIALIPHVFGESRSGSSILALIVLVTISAFFANVAANARSSWVGDLIPSEERGRFFGRVLMYSAIFATLLSIVGGRFLDLAKSAGIMAFSWVFIVGATVGLAYALLFGPQADVPAASNRESGQMLSQIVGSFRNKALVVVIIYAIVWSLQAIAGPFVATYVLRDLKVTYLGFGVATATATLSNITFSPFWGRMIDKYGCKPVLVICTAMIVPVPTMWLWVDSPTTYYYIVGPVNLLVGFASAGVSVALNTLLYNVTTSAQRSVQFAVYAIVVTLIAAPMPAIGGHLPEWIRALGIKADLRCTFYATQLFTLACVFVARAIPEEAAAPTSDLLRSLPSHLKEMTKGK
jgi:MFS family permease